MNTNKGNVKGEKNYGTPFGMSSKKCSHNRRAAVDMKSANKHVRTATENQKGNSRSVSALSFSPHDMLFLSSADAGDLVFILCFFLPMTTLKV